MEVPEIVGERKGKPFNMERAKVNMTLNSHHHL